MPTKVLGDSLSRHNAASGTSRKIFLPTREHSNEDASADGCAEPSSPTNCCDPRSANKTTPMPPAPPPKQSSAMRRRNVVATSANADTKSAASDASPLEGSCTGGTGGIATTVSSSGSHSPSVSASEWDEQETVLGTPILGSQDQHLTLMDEVVLLGLKDKQGYLSFLNDSISYVLRGCILMELALRRRIRLAREGTGSTAGGSSYAMGMRAPSDRTVEVVDWSTTGEVLLDETLRLLRTESNTVAEWLDLLSGETWNPLKIGFQLKQVRERIAKGLVDKGVLRTEKSSFVLFEMATHPLGNAAVKEDLIKRVATICLGRGARPSLRAIALVTAALTANVLERALTAALPSKDRDLAFNRAEDFMKEFVNFHFQQQPRNRPKGISALSGGGYATIHCNDPAFEMIVAVLSIFSRLDNLLY